jgi:hypothetical protein
MWLESKVAVEQCRQHEEYEGLKGNLHGRWDNIDGRSVCTWYSFHHHLPRHTRNRDERQSRQTTTTARIPRLPCRQLCKTVFG